MTKRLKSKFHICKKLKGSYSNVWGLPKGDLLRSIKGQNKGRKKISVYGKLLDVKQCLKIFYSNVQERSFKRNLLRSMQSRLTTLDRFISLLESRLDVVLFRSNFSSSLHESRQMISHGIVKINDKRVYNSGFKVSKLDVIEISKDLLKKELTINSHLSSVKSNFISRSLPSHLEIDYKTLSIVFLWDPSYRDVYYPVKSDYQVIQRFYK